MKKIIISFLLISVFAASAFSLPRVTENPKVLIPNDESVTVRWDDGFTASPITRTCEIVFGTSPSSYSGQINQTALGEAAFVPQDYGMTGGVYYCRVSDTVINETSREFKLYVESSNAPQYIAPANNAVLTTLNPVLSWQPVAGVPYYTVFMFDSKAEIDFGSGSVSITANVIWAATTDQTSIEYPQPDPSGYYDKLAPPPLVQGLTYSWAVVNNYSGSPSLISDAFSGVRAFTVNMPAGVSAPVLNLPADGAVFIDQEVDLSWNSVAGASGYKVFLSRKEEGSGEIIGSASVPVWSGETLDTQINIPYNIWLYNANYEWYVMAFDSAGKGVKSAVRSFNYQTTVYPVHIAINENTSLGTEAVPQAILFVETISGGSVNLYPYTCRDDGTFDIDLPAGTYKFTVKKEGYNTQDFSVAVAGAVSETFTITKSAYSLTGSITDDSANALQAVQLTAKLDGVTATASTLANGAFVLYLDNYGPWQITAVKAGYAETVITELVPDGTMTGNYDVIKLSPIIMVKNLNSVSGQVTNDTAQGIAGAVVAVSDISNTYTDTTDSSGNYFISLPDGSYEVAVSKTGFVPPPVSALSVALGESKVRNFTMSPEANIISGTVSRNAAPFAGVLVRAVPSAGSPLETYTDIFGAYSISAGIGDFTVDAYYSGYTSDQSRTVSFITGGNTSSGNYFAMSENGSFVNGTVTIDGTAPLEGAAVSNGVTTVYTDASGNYSLSMLSGTYTISGAKTGYSSDGDEPIIVGVGQTLNDIDFVLSPNACVINGVVRDNLGTPVSGAAVFAVGPGVTQTALTDSLGNYSISIMANPQVFSVYASKNGFNDSSDVVLTLSPGQISNGNNLTLIPDIGYLTGVVTDGVNPVNSAAVYILNASGVTKTVLTDTNGVYFTGVKTGGISVYASKLWYVNSSLTTDSVDSSNTTYNAKIINLQLFPDAQTITGIITDGVNPLNGVAVTVTAPGATINAMTDGSGRYVAMIPGLSTSVRVQCVKAGYTSTSDDVATWGIPAHLYHFDRAMSAAYGTLQMDIATSDVSPINAVVSANGNTKAVLGPSPVNAFAMPLLPGTYNITVSQAGYSDAVVSDVLIGIGTTYIGTLVLSQISTPRTISGNVNDGAVNIAGATVQVFRFDNTFVTSAVTDASGNFSIAGLLALAYNIVVYKDGYNVLEQNADVSLGDLTGLNLMLTEKTAALYANVTGAGTALQGAFITLEGTGSNLGYTGSGTTGADGGVTITALNAGDYNVTVSKSGYTTLNSTVNLTAGVTAQQEYTMTVNPGETGGVAGTIKDADANAMPAVTVNIYDQAFPDTVYGTASTDLTGIFWHVLPAGNYTLVPVKDGYSSSPVQEYISIAAGTTVTASFTMSPLTGGGITITGPLNPVFNTNIGGPYNFAAVLKDGDGKSVSAVFSWRVSPKEAGTITSAGVFTPDTNYIGQITIFAAAQGYEGAYECPVYQKLYAGMGAVDVTDYKGFSLQIPSGAYSPLNTLDRITMYKMPASGIYGTSRDLKAMGSIYKITEGVIFDMNCTVTLPIPAEYTGGNYSAGIWSADTLSWISIGGTVSGSSISTGSSTLSRFAVLSEMGQLAMDFSELTPNPFSPKRGELKIRYAISTKEGSSVETTIKVFNVAGKLVRTIIDRQFRAAGAVNNDYWDGRDESGKWCANGRYIIQVEIKDAKEKKQYLYSVAVVK
ncbi:MAG: carboxypeptidase regulatory-like domain-containing protein [Candidatus Goldbacteria bacterium]|nr:carboxypeptidase regulatory-like domain-containing protein [Candidatus Goldiibacteriota bacterium]